jgi:hypothetical protein
MTDRERSNIQEALLQLYLRLNGYFVSGFIVHSPEHGKNVTQVDALAVRHPFNKEPGRVIGPSPFLNPKGTDLLICEVKSRNQQLQFNEPLRESNDAIKDVLRWAGLFDDEETTRIAGELKTLLQPATSAPKAERGVQGAREVTVRPLLCSPERRGCRPNQPWFLCGGEIFSFIAKCLNPEIARESCSARYDTKLWGWLSPLVDYFKQRAVGGEMPDLYRFLQDHRGA